jgi:hypothetical protein
LQTQRAFVLDVFFLDRTILVPKIEDGSDHYPNAKTAEERPAVGWQPDEEDEDQGCRNDQTRSAPEKLSGCCWLRIPFHRNTQTAFYPKMARDEVAPALRTTERPAGQTVTKHWAGRKTNEKMPSRERGHFSWLSFREKVGGRGRCFR